MYQQNVEMTPDAQTNARKNVMSNIACAQSERNTK